jgi:hypothetical protein
MSFNAFNSFNSLIFAAPSPPPPIPSIITAAALDTIAALGEIPLTGIAGTFANYSVFNNGSVVATGQTGSTYTMTGFGNNVQIGPVTLVPYNHNGIPGNTFTVTGGNGYGQLYTWAQSDTPSFSSTIQNSTTLACTGAFSNTIVTFSGGSAVPDTGSQINGTDSISQTYTGMLEGTQYTFYVYPINGDGVNANNPSSQTVTTTGVSSSNLILYYPLSADRNNYAAGGAGVDDTTGTYNPILSNPLAGLYSQNINSYRTNTLSRATNIVIPTAQIGEGFTCVVWFNANATTGSGLHTWFGLSSTSAGSSKYHIGYSAAANSIQVWINGSSNSYHTVGSISNTTIFNRNWNMIAHTVTCTSTTGAASSVIYLNNVPYSTTFTGYNTFAATYGYQRMGHREDNVDAYWPGYTANFRFYTRPLSATEIGTLYTSNK